MGRMECTFVYKLVYKVAGINERAREGRGIENEKDIWRREKDSCESEAFRGMNAMPKQHVSLSALQD